MMFMMRLPFSCNSEDLVLYYKSHAKRTGSIKEIKNPPCGGNPHTVEPENRRFWQSRI